jgi:NADH:ubiquinone oxidoreductase subunit 6 (subunit J)
MTALLNTIQFLLVDIWPITAVVVLDALPSTPAAASAGARFWIGLGIGLCALVAAGLFLMPPGEAPPTAIPEVVLFYVFSGIAVVSGVLLVTQRNPARAALSFALVVLSSCGLFLLLAAPFLMAATTIVYAGAIVVTFLFVLMLSQQEGVSDADFRSREPFLASVAGFVLLGTLLYVLRTGYGTDELDEMLARARQLKDRVAGLRERAGQPAQVGAALKEARRMLQRAKPEDPDSRDGDIEQLRSDLEGLGDQTRGIDASNLLGSAINTLDNPIRDVLGLGFKAETGEVKPADAQKALGGLEEALAAMAEAGGRWRALGFLQPGDRPLSDLERPAREHAADRAAAMNSAGRTCPQRTSLTSDAPLHRLPARGRAGRHAAARCHRRASPSPHARRASPPRRTGHEPRADPPLSRRRALCCSVSA